MWTIREADVTYCALGGQTYPQVLVQQLGPIAPKSLSLVGNNEVFLRPSVGFCGSRNATSKGTELAARIASELAVKGFVIVSGYARGVDIAAHRASLEAGGNTVIVLPEGIQNFRVRKDLRECWDWDRVAVISQFPPEASWRNYRAMQRNLTIIGLSGAMVVIEAGASGGTFDAGLKTIDYHVPLFVVKFGVEGEGNKGNSILIGKGGVPILRSRQSGEPNVRAVEDAAKAHWRRIASQAGDLGQTEFDLS